MRTKKKIAMLVAMAAAAAVVLVALVGSGPASAQMIWGVIQCDSNPCYATGAHEVVFEQVGDGVADNMYAQGGHDNLRAQNYTNDNDTANGGYRPRRAPRQRRRRPRRGRRRAGLRHMRGGRHDRSGRHLRAGSRSLGGARRRRRISVGSGVGRSHRSGSLIRAGEGHGPGPLTQARSYFQLRRIPLPRTPLNKSCSAASIAHGARAGTPERSPSQTLPAHTAPTPGRRG